MIFKTQTREYQDDTAVGLLHAIRSDGTVAGAARRPSHAFLDRWIRDFDRRTSVRGITASARDEALAVELLLLCQEYRLGVFVRAEPNMEAESEGA
jgi:hypothetical protein